MLLTEVQCVCGRCVVSNLLKSMRSNKIMATHCLSLFVWFTLVMMASSTCVTHQNVAYVGTAVPGKVPAKVASPGNSFFSSFFPV